MRKQKNYIQSTNLIIRYINKNNKLYEYIRK